MNEENSRRDFLRQLGGLLLAAGAGQFLEADANPAKSPGRASPGGQAAAARGSKPAAGVGGKPAPAPRRYKVANWTGDDFTLGHQLRTREMPPAPVETDKHYDFIIVGGGVAGLTSAYYLRDHNVLLLEQYDELGGQSRGASHRGIAYSYGAAYVGDIDGIYGDLYSEIGIKPVTIPPRKNSWFWQDKWYPDIVGSDKTGLYKEFAMLTKQSKPVWKTMPEDPTADNVNTDSLNRLDNSRFIDELRGYSPKFVELLDSYMRSMYCGGLDQISALAGYLGMTDLITPSYVFEGGNTAIPKALVTKINGAGGERLVRNSFVWEVSVGDDQTTVIYSTRDGAMHKATCRHAIITAPPLVAARFMNGIEDKLKGLLLQMKFGSYLVANCLLDKRMFVGTYDNWVAKPFSFADITVAETPYILNNSYKPEMGSVLTIYQPYAPGSAGRTLLLAGDRQQFASSIVSQLDRLVGHLSSHLDEVVLSRWGHAMAVLGPGYFGRLRKIHAASGDGAFTLANNSMQGLPCAESAITAARLAADRALNRRPKLSSRF